MKRTLYILTFALSAAILVSCVDSLGVDPEYIKIPIPDNVTLGKYVINGPQVSFSETSHDGAPENKFTHKLSNYTFDAGSYKVDTSGNTPIIWIEMDVSYNLDSTIYSNSHTRVHDFYLKLDSAVYGQKYILNGSEGSSNWFTITIINDITGKTTTFNGNEIEAEMIFLEYNIEKRTIKCQLTVEFPDKDNLTVVRFSGIFTFSLNYIVDEKQLSFDPDKV